MNPKNSNKVLVSKRLLLRLERSEKVCQEVRHLITKRACDVGPNDWVPVVDHLSNWMKVTPKKVKYERA
jgi:hypothetical protein